MTPLDTLRRITSAPAPITRYRRAGRRFFVRFVLSLTLVVALGFTLAATSERFTNLLMIPITEDQGLRKSDVVIVLGAGSRSTTPHLPPQADARVATGVALVRDGWAPRMILAGGYNRHTALTEAPLMAEIAFQEGATAEQVIQEPASKDTWENATNSLSIMKAHGWTTALVVTSPYHTWRACMIFQKQSADVRCIPAPLRTERSHTVYERLMDTRSVVREYGAIVYFFFKHYI